MRRKFTMLVVLISVFMMLVPSQALAGDIDVLSIPVLSDDSVAELGTVFTQSPGAQLSVGDEGIIRLPSDFKFLRSKNEDEEMNTETVTVDGAVYAVDDWNTLTVDGTTWLCVPGTGDVDPHTGETGPGYFREGTEPFSISDSAPDYYPSVTALFNPLSGGQIITQSVKVGKPDTNNFEFPVTYNGDDSALFTNLGGGAYGFHTGLHVTKLDENEIKIEIVGYSPYPSKESYMFIHNGSVYVDEGYEGVIYAKVSAPSGSGITTGEIPIGRVSGGDVDIEVVDEDTFNDNGTVTFRITEDRPGALEVDDESVKLILPDGFLWDSSINGGDLTGDNGTGWKINNIYGSIDGEVVINDDELMVKVVDQDSSKDGNQGTNEETCIEIEATIEVVDETDAELGDIIAKVKGESDISVKELVVGKYGEFGVEVSVEDPESVYAGKTGQEIADITIEESIEGSLVDGRTITLTLPNWAIWGALPDQVEDGVELDLTSFPGKDGQVVKYTITNDDESAAELTFEDMEVLLSPDAEEGDLVVEISGSAGIDEEVVVAEVVKPITVEATVAPNIVIGRSAQDIAEITITEVDAGILNEDKNLILDLPKDIEWDDYDVEVVEGDLEIGDIDDDDNTLTIEIDDDSNDASTIKITGTVVAYRTVPEGAVDVKVKGDALIEVNDLDELESQYSAGSDYGAGDYYVIDGADGDEEVVKYDEDGLFEDNTTIAKVKVAAVGTPAPEDTMLTTSVTLGENGSYISDGRIMVQLRDAATALGVSEQNLLWDNATKTATFIKGDRAVQITVGKSEVVMNGTPLTTDKGAEIKDGRTYVSLRAAGIAFGAATAWDNTTKTATLTIK
ncbi:MAG: copper amine oxidase N-terminal domain-containing protein [Firmicutes bacterium]|nr:copper amine oxidase N-terminal domain-containing protein [Bacillota bacterium]